MNSPQNAVLSLNERLGGCAESIFIVNNGVSGTLHKEQCDEEHPHH